MAFPILKHLATNPVETPYAIEKTLKVDRPTVHGALRILVKANFIELVSRKRLPTGLLRKEYRVTPQGIVGLLQAHPDHVKLTKEYVRVLAEKNAPFLPSVFGKWEYFREQSVEDLAYKYLLISVTHTEDEVDRLSDVASGRELKHSFGSQESMHRHDIYEGMLVRAWMFGTDEAKKWGEVIKRDKELSSLVEKEIARLHGEAREGVKYWDGALKDFRGEKHAVLSLVVANSEDEEVWEEFEEWWRYARARALDEGKPLPTPEELTAQATEELLQKEGIRVPKKTSRKSRMLRHISS